MLKDSASCTAIMKMDKTKIAVAVFSKRAKEYQDKFMDTKLYQESFDLFCHHITKENADILELACGPGNITKYLLKKRPDFKLLGIDLSLNMIDLARANNPTATFELMDCRAIDLIDKRYNAIMCGFALPYLSKEEAQDLITHAFRLLASEGVLYLSTMEGDYSSSGFQRSSSGDEIYIHFHEEEYLVQALKATGFEIVELQRKHYLIQEGTETTDMIIIAIKR